MDGMWVTTLEKIAQHTKDTVKEIHTHARIEVPGFPDAGAQFTPAACGSPRSHGAARGRNLGHKSGPGKHRIPARPLVRGWLGRGPSCGAAGAGGEAGV